MDEIMTAAKQKPAISIEEQIVELHEKIEALVDAQVAKQKECSPTIPSSVLRALLIARGDATGRCRCSIYRHLVKTGALGIIDESV
jgi:hypothetical protein